MNASRRIAAVLSGLALAGAVSAGPALAATGEADTALAPLTEPSQGFCNQDEDGQVKKGGDGHDYRCTYVWGLGWYWMPT